MNTRVEFGFCLIFCSYKVWGIYLYISLYISFLGVGFLVWCWIGDKNLLVTTVWDIMDWQTDLRLKHGEHENVSAKVERISSVIILATLTCKICVNVMVYNFLIHVFDKFIAFLVDPFHSNMNLVLNLPIPCSSSFDSIFCDKLEGKSQALIRGIEGHALWQEMQVSHH